MKNIILFFFCCISYITMESQNKDFSTIKDDHKASEKTDKSLIKEHKPLNVEAKVIYSQKVNSNFNSEKESMISNNITLKDGGKIRRSLNTQAVKVDHFSTEIEIHNPIYSKEVKNKSLEANKKYVTATAIAIPAQK